MTVNGVQGELFPKSPSLAEARRLRDEGMARVEHKAGGDFAAEAELFILGCLRANGRMSCEDIVDAAKEAGVRPHNDRAFGPVFMRLRRRGQIRNTGYVRRRKGRGAHGAAVWEVV